MEKYNYYECVKSDINDNLEEWFDNHDIKTYNDIDDIVSEVYEDFFVKDSVTGNASGSYTFNTWQAEENICHNIDLLQADADDCGVSVGEYLERGAETCDVIIRCYVLGQVCKDVVEDYVKEHFPNFVDDLGM